jgi:hypothetical protein
LTNNIAQYLEGGFILFAIGLVRTVFLHLFCDAFSQVIS